MVVTLAALGYVVVLILTLFGIPGIGQLALPGLEQLDAGTPDGPRDLGPGTVVEALPSLETGEPVVTPSPPSDADEPSRPGAVTTTVPTATTLRATTTTTAVATTTTASPQTTTTSAPAPGSTSTTAPAGPPDSTPGGPDDRPGPP